MARMIESLIDGMYESRDRPRVAYMLIHADQTKKRYALSMSMLLCPSFKSWDRRDRPSKRNS